MRIQDSAIFQEHRDAQEALRRERKYHNLERGMFCGLVLGVILIFAGVVSLSYQVPPELGVVVLASGFGVLIPSFLAGMSFRNSRDLAFRSIEANISRLAGAIGQTVEELCSRPVEDVVFAGQTTMVKYAGDIIDFEIRVKEARLEASVDLISMTRNFLQTHKDGLKARFDNLHAILLVFRLVPPEYGWAFKEAEKLRKLDSSSSIQ